MSLQALLWNAAKALGLGGVAALIYIEVCAVAFGPSRPDHYAIGIAIGGVLATLFGVGFGYRAARQEQRQSKES
jgi:hypothetical protein